MVLWITLSSVLVLLLVLLTRWIGISLEGDQSGVTVVASFSKLKFTFQPGNSSKKTEKRKAIEKPEVKPDEKGGIVRRKIVSKMELDGYGSCRIFPVWSRGSSSFSEGTAGLRGWKYGA